RVNQCNPGTIVAGGTTYAIPAGGVTPANASALVPGTSNRCEHLRDQDLIPVQIRHSGSLAFRQELGGVTLSGDAYFSERRFRFNSAQTVTSIFVPTSNPYFVTPPGAAAAVAQAGGLTVNYGLSNDLGPNITTTGSARSFGGNLKADFSLGGEWRGEVQGFYGRDNSEALQNRFDGTRLNAAVRSTNLQTAFNPFGGPGTPQSVLDGINTNLFYPQGINELKQFQAKIDGPLMTLPGGQLRVAVGAEYMHAFSIFDFDSGPVGNVVNRYARKSRNIKAAFAEAFIPLVGSNNAVSGIERLEIDIAGRIEDYSDFGSTANPKIGINYAPVRGMTFRGSYGTSFRAPLLSDLQTATAGLFVQNYSDPTSPTGNTIGLARSGGNPDLGPERATTYSFGLDIAPVGVPDLTLSAGFFHVSYSNQIAQFVGDLSILQREAVFSSIITRNPDPAFIAGEVARLPLTGVVPNPLPLFIDGALRNLGSSISQGIDFSGDYTFDVGPGRLRLRAAGTVFTRYDTRLTPPAPTVDALNTIFNPLSFRARTSALYSTDTLNAFIALNHVGGYRNDRIAPVEKVSSFTTIDLHFDYTVKSRNGLANGLMFGLDVTNLFDRDPPFVNLAPGTNGGGGFDPTAASALGRLVSFTVGKRF
ncbi:TonB-dependent receptor, partial [Polymorphobacter sp.]|uniref:TonB-dependent receptor n=1 Tax=Polymorphobacter sp. TaxID=1909290 RepID=UPI003F72A5B6